MDFFKSYSFLFTTLVSSTIAITLYFKNKKKKQLSYILDSWDTIVTKLNHDIKIYYKDNTEITDDLSMVLIRFTNTGNEPIKKDDFESEIVLKLIDSKVFDVSVTATKPEGLNIEVYKDEAESLIAIKPLLLNPKDEFTIKLLTSKLIPTFKVTTRIVGGSIEEYGKGKISLWKYFLRADFLSFVLTFLSILLSLKIIDWITTFVKFVMK